MSQFCGQSRWESLPFVYGRRHSLSAVRNTLTLQNAVVSSCPACILKVSIPEENPDIYWRVERVLSRSSCAFVSPFEHRSSKVEHTPTVAKLDEHFFTSSNGIGSPHRRAGSDEERAVGNRELFGFGSCSDTVRVLRDYGKRNNTHKKSRAENNKVSPVCRSMHKTFSGMQDVSSRRAVLACTEGHPMHVAPRHRSTPIAIARDGVRRYTSPGRKRHGINISVGSFEQSPQA